MAINQNHLFEDLNGVKCAIVEKNALQSRVEFLTRLLEYNNYKVIVVASPPPKVAPATSKPGTVTESIPGSEGTPGNEIEVPIAIPTFTIGVTDVMFNAKNAIFGRLLHTPDRHVVTLAYWEEKESVAKDEVPYYENK